MNRRRVAGFTMLVPVLALCACAETTVDADPTEATTSATGATVPVVSSALTGSAADLGARLVAQARALSDHIVEGDGDVEALAELEATWTALRPDAPEALRADFETAIDLARRAVDRRRPADADKASNNLATLVAAADLT